MGAKTWMVVYSNGDVPAVLNKNLDTKTDGNLEILKSLFPNNKFNEVESGNLAFTCPGSNTVQIANLGELLVVATEEVAIDNPSKISSRFISFSNYKYIYIFAMHSGSDWFAFSVWDNKTLIRSLSISPDSGIIEDIGEKLSFELEYWAGQRPAVDSDEDEESYPLPFHPLEFGESALLHLMGYQYEGVESLNKIDPEKIVMHCYQKRSWWKFW